MIGVLKEELHESHSGGTEEGMIRASLRGLKGSATEQANVRSLLLLFALVPEDTHCPLEVLLLMFKAVHEECWRDADAHAEVAADSDQSVASAGHDRPSVCARSGARLCCCSAF